MLSCCGKKVEEPDEAYADLLIEGFFQIYPVIVERYNAEAPRTVIVTVSDDYEGIGGIGHWADGGGGRAGNEIRIKNSMRKFSEVHSELRVFTHELMHLAQTYRSTAGLKKGLLPPGVLEIQRENLAIMEENLARREALTRGYREDVGDGADQSSRDD